MQFYVLYPLLVNISLDSDHVFKFNPNPPINTVNNNIILYSDSDLLNFFINSNRSELFNLVVLLIQLLLYIEQILTLDVLIF